MNSFFSCEISYRIAVTFFMVRSVVAPKSGPPMNLFFFALPWVYSWSEHLHCGNATLSAALSVFRSIGLLVRHNGVNWKRAFMMLQLWLSVWLSKHGVGKGIDGDCMPLPNRPQRYGDPASLVFLFFLPLFERFLRGREAVGEQEGKISKYIFPLISAKGVCKIEEWYCLFYHRFCKSGKD